MIRKDVYFVCRVVQYDRVSVYINIALNNKKKSIKDFTVPPAHTTSPTFHAAYGLFFKSSFHAVRGTHSRRAGTACGRIEKQTRGGNTSLITECSRQPLSKEESEDAQWSVGNTSGTALRPP
ncbi:hypothetical protein TcCL_Unassigned03570, partial [Trypanosoma cruzi]